MLKLFVFPLFCALISGFELPRWFGGMHKSAHTLSKQAGSLVVAASIWGVTPMLLDNMPPLIQPAHAEGTVVDQGANTPTNTKIKKGGASTLQQGISKTITRGVNLDGSDFSGQKLRGVAFQQSIVRDTSFKGSDLYSASFFE